MKLYHSPFSSNARRAVLTVLELGLDVELVEVKLERGEHRQPEFLRRNPNGKVPVLEDDDFVLWESYAIMQYLADRPEGRALYPVDARARADVNRWMYWCAAHLSPGVSALNWENFIKGLLGLGAPDPGRVEHGETMVRECVRVLDGHLANRAYLVGDAVTIADLAVAPKFMHAAAAKFPEVASPHLDAWLARIQARDSWKKTES